MINNGWMRALDIQMDMLKWHKTPFGQAFTTNFFSNILMKELLAGKATQKQVDHDVAQMEINTRQHLWRGDTMYVTTDMEHIILQAAHDLPDDYLWDAHTLLCPLGFCMLEEPIYGMDKNGIKMGVAAISWYEMLREGERLTVINFWSDSHDANDESTWDFVKDLERDGIPVPPMTICHYYILGDGENVRPGKAIGLPQGSELVDGILTIFAAINIIAHQTIGEPIKIPPDRATRRRIARDFTNSPERMITLITLRRKSAKKEVDPDAPPVPWSRRWIVRGHWRRQPIKNGWHWKYIYEYVKGPEDKPLIITERRVFNFRR